MPATHAQLSGLIVSLGLEAEADAGQFDKITAAAHAPSVITPRHHPVGGKETLGALLMAGHDAPRVVAKMRSDPLGSEVMDTLIASGVDWGDELTQVILGGLIDPAGPITEEVAATLVSLSVTVTSPAQDAGVPDDAIAEEFQRAWIVYTTTQVTQVQVDTAAATQTATNAAAQAVYDTAKADAAELYRPVAAKHNAVTGWMSVFEGTPAEIQAEADELLASPDGNGSHGA